MSKHTPGPWLVRTFHTHRLGHSDLWVVDSTPDRNGRFVGSVIHRPLSNPDDDANAHLIAAAPDLLGSLAALTNIVDVRLLGTGGNPSEDLDLRETLIQRVKDARAAIQKAGAQ